MDQLEFFHKVIRILGATGLRYMVVGSYASGFWGEPRATLDVDVVIAIGEADLPVLGQVFPSDEFYFSPEAAREAIRLKRQFNIIHPESGNKIDVMVQGSDPWAREQLNRRLAVAVAPGLEAFVATPEDVILGKLLYYKEGGSQKHLRDIAGMIKMQRGDLDLGYIQRWSADLGVSAEWEIARVVT